MASQDFVKLGLQFALMLGFALFFGQLMRRLRQPAILGEMIGGIIIGPTILGLLAPGLYTWLFKSSTEVGIVRDGFDHLFDGWSGDELTAAPSQRF